MKKVKKVTKTVAKRKAYKAFQIFLRTLWTVKGTVPCYTCDKPLTFKQVQVGHWVTGHGNAVYINPDYVKPQGICCNIYKNGDLGEFRDRLRKELGNKVVDTLLRDAKESVSITVADYQELEKWYISEYEKISNNNN